MDLKKAGLYAVLVLVALLAVKLVVSTVIAVVSLLWTLVTGAVALAILLGVIYGAYRGVAWLRADRSGTEGRSVDEHRPNEQSLEGDASEFEARLDDAVDDIDRELDRSRSE